MGTDDLQLGRLGRMESIKHGGADGPDFTVVAVRVYGSQVKSPRENRRFFVCLLSDETLLFYHLEKPPLNSAQIREFLGKIGFGRSGAAAWNLDGTAPARTQPGTHGEGPNGWPVCDRIWGFPIGVP